MAKINNYLLLKQMVTNRVCSYHYAGNG